MSSTDQALFPRARRPRRRLFPVGPAIALGLILLLAVVAAPFAWQGWQERQAWAQGQAIARAYLQTADADDRKAQAEVRNSAYGHLMEDGITNNFDLAKAQAQLAAGRDIIARYRRLAADRKAQARAAVAALKVPAKVRDRYLARLDAVVFHRATQLSHRLDAIAGIMDEEQALLEMLASHRGQWRLLGDYGIVFNRPADLQAFRDGQMNIYRREREEARIEPLKIPAELWTTTPP